MATGHTDFRECGKRYNLSATLALARQGETAVATFGPPGCEQTACPSDRAPRTVSFQFKGPDAYASPDLYDAPHLPGWLYVSVKSYGIVDSILEESELRSRLCESTDAVGAVSQTFNVDSIDARIDMFIGAIRG